MKLIIAGSRTFDLLDNFIDQIINGFDLTVHEVVCGMAQGVDTSGLTWGAKTNKTIVKFPADWDKHGKAAGHIRNKQMADYADALLLIWDGSSKGSSNMKENMLKLNKPIYEVILRKY